jgi:Na+/H+ antiporter NhaD/arsenite permease-like protein
MIVGRHGGQELLNLSAIAANGVSTILAKAEHSDLGVNLGAWTILPFAGTLLAIAILPLVVPHSWEKNRNKAIVAALLAVPIAAYLVIAWHDAGVEVLIEKAKEYASFIILLAALFIITGGIYVQGTFSGTPLVNTGFLALGAVLANLIGTTGASVLLIRPVLRANAARQNKVHIVIFFIFVVSNCGGLLTPLGDPPLFLGFLKGVPFEWTLRLWPEWLLVNLVLLAIFNLWDQAAINREERERVGSQLEEVQKHAPLRLHGLRNLLFLLGVVATIYASGRGWLNGGEPWQFGIQEGLMLTLAVASYFLTPKINHINNRFTFGPIIEVAVLFAGIFVTMAPALLILNAWGQGQRDVLGVAFGLSEPWQFFWAAGSLSSFLDNAPTYLTFAATACGKHGIAIEDRYLETFLSHGDAEMKILTAKLLAAISCGAVFMGANTYIGNGPNFMVKAIAEENGVKMPSFFGYMAYSCGILLPTFALVTYFFFL